MPMSHLMNCRHSATGWCMECVGELDDEAVRYHSMLGNLLALIHGDGGHVAEHLGFKAAAKAAEKVIILDRIRRDEALQALMDIDQAGHNPADLFPDLIGLPDRYERLVARLAQRANDALVCEAKRRGSYGNIQQPAASAAGIRPVQDAGVVRQGRTEGEGH